MTPRARHAVFLALLLAACLLASLPLPAAAHADPDPHVSVHMETEDDDTARLLYHLHTGLVVQEDAEGAYIRASVPEPFHTLDAFRPDDPAHKGTSDIVFDDNGTRWAEFRWEADAPDAGTTVDDVTLSGQATFDPEEDQRVVWDRLDQDPLKALVSLPETHGMSGAGELIPRFHGTPEGRVEWSDIDLDATTLSFTIRTVAVGPDPARAVPPFPYSHVLIVAGAGLVTGLLWWWGFHEDEERRKRL